MSNTDLTENRNACAREGLTVPASYKTPSVLLIYIYISKSDKNLVRHRGNKIVYEKRKDSFPHGQPGRYDDHIICVAMTST